MLTAGRKQAGVKVIPVLLYHAVTDEPPPDQPEYAVSPQRFAEHVEAIAASGRVALTITELGAALRGEREMPAYPAALTFDDGFADTPAAAGRLADLGIKSTVFVATGRLRHPAARPALPPSALAELAGCELIELGSHTVTHPRLDDLSVKAATQEIAISKLELEQAIGRPVTSFAYPHGAYDGRVRRAVIAAGFSAAAAVKDALSHSADDSYAIARVTVMADTTVEQVRRLLSGEGARLAWSDKRLLTRGNRGVHTIRRWLGPRIPPALTQ